MASWLLGLRSYLFGDETATDPDADEAGDNVDAAAEAAEDDDDWEVEEDEEEELVDAVEEQPDLPPANNFGPLGNPLGPAHAALIHREPRTGFQDYDKPDFFPLRVRQENILEKEHMVISVVYRSLACWC